MHHLFENCQPFLTDRKYFPSESVVFYTLLIRGTSDMAAFPLTKEKYTESYPNLTQRGNIFVGFSGH